MKKLLLILLSLPIISFGQKFGIKTGVNLSNVYGEDKEFIDDDFTNPLKTGLRIAVFSQFGDGPYKLTIESGFSQKGYIMKDEEVNVEGSVKAKGTYNFNCLDINTMASFFVSDLISINSGLGLSFVLNGKATLEYYDETGLYVGYFQDQTDAAEIGEDLTAMDLGLNIGTTFYLNENFLIDANYYLGLLTLDPDGDVSAYNNVVAISIGYVF
jgi:hypothetical protein